MLIGVVDLTTLSATSTLMTPQEMGVPVSPIFNFTNCVTLSANMMNLHWTVNGDNVEFGIETLDTPETWAAFGVSDPTVPTVTMVNADVAITGIHPSFPNNGFFAQEYDVSSRSQCNFDTSDGACPASTPQSGIQLVDATVESGVRLVRYSRSIFGGRYPLQIQDNVPYAWAFGPLSSDTSQPVVLYHENNRAASDFTLRLSDPVQACSPISASAKNKPSSNSEKRFVRGSSSFDITIGPNPNYPNPPGWGISYYVNGVESPTIVVKRGDVLIFNVMATESHPLYITSSMVGGRLSNPDSGETILAGDSRVAAGTVQQPYTLTWTVPADFTTAFYQCYDHQKLGWYIAEESQPEAGASQSDARRLSMSVGLGLVLLLFL